MYIVLTRKDLALYVKAMDEAQGNVLTLQIEKGEVKFDISKKIL